MVVTFGEIMLKLVPPAYERIIQADCMKAEYAGAEANVAVSLANYGLRTSFVSRLPQNEIGDAALRRMRSYGVGVENVVRGGDRIGIYFVEKGASQRPSKVIYDRRNSAFATSSATDYNWDAVFDGASWFHFTGITPALSDNLARICLEACEAAHSKGLTVSCDLNYRKKLWDSEKAQKTMDGLCRHVDVCIANEEDAQAVFGIKAAGSDASRGIIDQKGYESVARQLADRYPFTHVAITLRESLSASDNNWSAILFDGQRFYNSRKYQMHIVDRIGGGDAFGAGLIYGLLALDGPQQAVDFATAASCLKHTIEGDFNQVSVHEVLDLVGSGGSGRIVR